MKKVYPILKIIGIVILVGFIGFVIEQVVWHWVTGAAWADSARRALQEGIKPGVLR